MRLTHFAHEVYVLNKSEITHDQHNHGVNIWHALSSGHDLALFFMFVVLIGALFLVAIYLKSRPLFKSIGAKIDNVWPRASAAFVSFRKVYSGVAVD
jgi:hypothetical protein